MTDDADRAQSLRRKPGRPKTLRTRFLEDTVKQTGANRRTLELSLERGEKIAEDVILRIRRTHLDTGAYLDRIKNLAHEEQREAVERDLAQPRTRERPPPLHRLKKEWVAASAADRAAFLEWLDERD